MNLYEPPNTTLYALKLPLIVMEEESYCTVMPQLVCFIFCFSVCIPKISLEIIFHVKKKKPKRERRAKIRLNKHAIDPTMKLNAVFLSQALKAVF